MLGGIEVPLWVIIAVLLLRVSPILIAGLIYFFGKKLGKYRILLAVIILIFGLLFIEDLIELLF